MTVKDNWKEELNKISFVCTRGTLAREERAKVERLIQFLLNQKEKEVVEEAIKLVGTHTEHDGSYCDTGEDMEWACRSECVEMGIKRLRDNLLQNK